MPYVVSRAIRGTGHIVTDIDKRNIRLLCNSRREAAGLKLNKSIPGNSCFGIPALDEHVGTFGCGHFFVYAQWQVRNGWVSFQPLHVFLSSQFQRKDYHLPIARVNDMSSALVLWVAHLPTQPMWLQALTKFKIGYNSKVGDRPSLSSVKVESDLLRPSETNAPSLSSTCSHCKVRKGYDGQLKVCGCHTQFVGELCEKWFLRPCSMTTYYSDPLRSDSFTLCIMADVR